MRVSCSDDGSCNCVVFRLDDVQDYWLTDVQKSVIGVFEENSTPLSVGIIANNFGEDDSMLSFIRSNLESAQHSGWNIEIANHGYNHESFSTFTKQEQKDLLQAAVARTVSQLTPYVTQINTFIPPFNDFNQDTIEALDELGFESISSQIPVDQGPIGSNSVSQVSRWPINAATSDLEISDYFVGISATQTLQQIRTQINDYGFSAVMLHPQEFAILSDDHLPTPDIDERMIDELRDLIQLCQDEGIEIVTFRDLKDRF